MPGITHLKYPLLLLIIAVACSVNLLHSQIPKEKLLVWFKADEGVKTEGDKVVEWQDVSGNNLHAKCNTPGEPLLINNTQNGFPAIRFNGKDNGLETPLLHSFTNKRGTILVVAKVNGRSYRSSVGMGVLISSYHGNGVCWELGAGTKGYSYYDGVGGEGLTVNEISARDWEIISISRINDTVFEFHHNGRFVNDFNVNNNQPSANTLKIGYNGLQHFGDEDISEVLNGELAEIIVYNRTLTTKELSSAHEYLSEKYKINLLPAPYYAQWWFYGLIALVLVLLILLLLKNRQNIQIKKQLQALKIQQEIAQERLRISRDIHDEIGSGLSKISLMANQSKNLSETNNTDSDHIENISKTADALIDNMRDLVWALNPENATLDNLAARIHEFASEFTEDLPVKMVLNLPDCISPIKITQMAQRNLFLTVKEALHNCVKHAGASVIELTLKLSNDVLEIEINDNGKGFDNSVNNRSGNGLRNMKERITAIGGNFNLISSAKGTCIRIEIGMNKLSEVN